MVQFLLQAGLERLELNIKELLLLEWMIPSAAQGTIALATREKDDTLKEILEKISC